jgi:type VII secretion-associated serine protease mycosin
MVAAVGLPAPAARADDVREAQWHLGFLNITTVHQITKGAGITVAVVDSGVDPHPDLLRNLLPGTVVDPTAIGDGRSDRIGHGTAMAGLIAAHGRGTGNGALGIAPEAKIVPIIDNADQEVGSSENTAAGIEWATTHGADIINVSSAGGPSPRLRAAVEAALAADIVIVAGVGNRPGALAVQFPAFYAGVIAVGATDRNGQHAAISVTGRGVVIAAPGVEIQTTRQRGQYAPGTGTSDATAIVSGAVALIRSRYPELSATEVVHRLTATATDKGPPGWDEQYGFGVLNIVAALTADVPSASPEASHSPSAEAAPRPAPDRGGDDAGGPAVPIAIAALVAIGAGIAVLALRGRARRRKDEPVA